MGYRFKEKATQSPFIWVDAAETSVDPIQMAVDAALKIVGRTCRASPGCSFLSYRRVRRWRPYRVRELCDVSSFRVERREAGPGLAELWAPHLSDTVRLK